MLVVIIPSASRSICYLRPEVSRVRCAACNERCPHLDDIILRQLGHLLHARGPHGDEVDQADGSLDPTRRQPTQHDTKHNIQVHIQQRTKRTGDQDERGEGGGAGSGSG